MPKGWCWCRLEEVLSKLTDGSHNPPPNSGEGYPVISAMNIKNGEIDLSNVIRYVSEADYNKENARTQIKKGDIILGIIGGSIGNLAFYNHEDKVIAQRSIAIMTSIINSRYAYYVLKSNLFQKEFLEYANGSAQGGVYLGALSNMLFPLPPQTEQIRIVEEVEKWKYCIDQIECGSNNIVQSINIAKSKILDLAIHGKLVPQDVNDEPASELLKRINPKTIASCDNPHYAEPYDLPDGWTWCKLIDICTFLSRGKSPKYSETDTTYPVFAQKCNLKEGGISLEKAQFLEPTTLNRWPDIYHLQTGDVLVNSTGTGTVGRTRLFNESCLGNYPFVVPDSHVSVIRTHGEIVSEYIFALMSSSWIQTYLEDNLAGSTNQKELYIGVLQNVDVPLPPVMEQTRIADKIEYLYQQLDNVANHIE